MDKCKIQENIDLLISNIVNQYNCEKSNLDIADVYINNNIHITGEAFQLASICETLLKTKKYCYDEKLIPEISRISNEITNKLLKHFNNYKFNYFNGKIIPDDLDTASVICRGLINQENVKREFLDSIKSNLKPDGHIVTWFGEDIDFNRIRYKSGKNSHHIEVELNACLTILEGGFSDFYNYVDYITNTVTLEKLKSHWYLLSSYPLFVYSKIIMFNRNFLSPEVEKDLLSFTNTLLDDYEGWHLVHFSKNFVAPFSELKKMHREVNRSTLLLDRAILTGSIIILLSKNLSNKKQKILVDWLFQDIEEYMLLTMNATPYWSLGFRYYDSRVFSISLLLNIICDIKKLRI